MHGFDRNQWREEVVDMRGEGADQSIESLVAGGLGPRSCSHCSFYNVSKFSKINL